MNKKRKHSSGTHASHHESEHKLENKLVQNLIELQKINVTMIEKFDKLTNQISSLLSLFEMTAKSFAEHPAYQVSEKDKEFLEKIDKLLEQNKTIAKGLIMMEERIRDKVHPQRQEIIEKPREIMRPAAPIIEKKEEMQPSLSNSDRPLPRF